MAAQFKGFPKETLSFFRGLDKNNNREWFQERKPVFEARVKAPMVELVEAVNAELAQFAPDHINEPKKAIYRIYRDTRFSKDKTPYKVHIGAIFPRRGLDKHGSGGYYFHLSHKEVMIAGGAYMPGKDELLAIRTHLAEHDAEFRKLARANRLTNQMGDLQGEELTRVPKGFAPDHPAADLIRKKQWCFFLKLKPAIALEPVFRKA